MTPREFYETLNPDQKFEYQERAGIMEEGCNITREESELRAMELLRDRWEANK